MTERHLGIVAAFLGLLPLLLFPLSLGIGSVWMSVCLLLLIPVWFVLPMHFGSLEGRGAYRRGQGWMTMEDAPALDAGRTLGRYWIRTRSGTSFLDRDVWTERIRSTWSDIQPQIDAGGFTLEVPASRPARPPEAWVEARAVQLAIIGMGTCFTLFALGFVVVVDGGVIQVIQSQISLLGKVVIAGLGVGGALVSGFAGAMIAAVPVSMAGSLVAALARRLDAVAAPTTVRLQGQLLRVGGQTVHLDADATVEVELTGGATQLVVANEQERVVIPGELGVIAWLSDAIEERIAGASGRRAVPEALAVIARQQRS